MHHSCLGEEQLFCCLLYWHITFLLALPGGLVYGQHLYKDMNINLVVPGSPPWLLPFTLRLYATPLTTFTCHFYNKTDCGSSMYQPSAYMVYAYPHTVLCLTIITHNATFHCSYIQHYHTDCSTLPLPVADPHPCYSSDLLPHNLGPGCAFAFPVARYYTPGSSHAATLRGTRT